MSYVEVPPAYYQQQQPGTPFHEGAPGWSTSPMPYWGDNPNDAWPARQAVHGLGAENASSPPAPKGPPFYAAGRPFQDYVRVGIAPWGRFPNGPAYASPRESYCPNCVGLPSPQPAAGLGDLMRAARLMNDGQFEAAVKAASGLGQACPRCTIAGSAGQCLPCPPDSDVDECRGCVNGQPAASFWDRPLLAPVVVGVVTSALAALVVGAMVNRKASQ